ncbi:killer cell lectin-like receptor subfamily G member 1 isoform X2 [Bufo gargarizans]|uniref:killer cell lectin-like receptor subfamily G member 1 isoform X2 n=1 Tax=Bufo gargarizans TaxID=30331 RepID=UPI001CF0FF34|nr:killer cell lectin-like receptor subfamily G member 1 isoform X2 [Bufo gargarizans]
MSPRKDAERLMQVLTMVPLTDSPSPASAPLSSRMVDVPLQLSYQSGAPDTPAEEPDTQDTLEENTSLRAQGRWRCLKRARDLCQNRLVQMAISLIVVAVLGVVLGGPCRPVSPSCPNKWMRSEGKCYFISRETNDWNSRLEFCRSEGGTLLTMDNETQEDIKTLSNLTGEYWVGLKKEGGEWKQMDGSVWTGPIEYDGPQLSCCVLDSGRYLAFACSTHRPWICVKSAVAGISNAGSTDRDHQGRLSVC